MSSHRFQLPEVETKVLREVGQKLAIMKHPNSIIIIYFLYITINFTIKHAKRQKRNLLEPRVMSSMSLVYN